MVLLPKQKVTRKAFRYYLKGDNCMKYLGGPVDEACGMESLEADDVVKDLRKGVNERVADSEILAYLQKKVGEISDEEYGQVTYRSREGAVS